MIDYKDFPQFDQYFFDEIKYSVKGDTFSDLFNFADAVHPCVYEFYSPKLMKIYEYVKENNLLSEEFDLMFYAIACAKLTYELPEKVNLPPNIKNTFLEIFEYNMVCHCKMYGKNIVVLKDRMDFFQSLVTMQDRMFLDIRSFTKPKDNGSAWKQLKNAFTIVAKIDREVIAYCYAKTDKIFQYVYDNRLKPDAVSWEEFGHYLWQLLYNPYQTDEIKLSQELIDYIRNEFEWKRITLEKIDGKNTVVFAESSC